MTTVTEAPAVPRSRPRKASRTASVLLSVFALFVTASVAYGVGVSHRPAAPPVTVIVKCPVVGDHVVTLPSGTRDTTVGCPR